jgi:hypothetical protein
MRIGKKELYMSVSVKPPSTPLDWLRRHLFPTLGEIRLDLIALEKRRNEQKIALLINVQLRRMVAATDVSDPAFNRPLSNPHL